MSKINKIYPAAYGGESEQSDELILDTQCRKMVNCVPDVVRGLERRNGLDFIFKVDDALFGKNIFHTYDRGEGYEEYIFSFKNSTTEPIVIYDKYGNKKTVNYTDIDSIYSYLITQDMNNKTLKAITVQDRTFIANTTQVVGQTTLPPPDEDYTNVAYYFLKRASNDTNNEYRYAVYLNGTAYTATGSKSDDAASSLASNINNNADNFSAVADGSIIKITTTLSSFTFKSWDSWGNQASIGWKGEISKLSDLPAKMPFDGTIVKITGNDNDVFTTYYVKAVNGVWIETRSPNDLRGDFTNMPIAVDRQSDGSFLVQTLTWEKLHIGDELTALTPSFVNKTIQDLFFFKNRFGIASSDSIVLSEEGGYYNFYPKTALQVIDTDVIDVSIASNQANKIYFVIPFQRSLYIFSKEAQWELTYSNTFSPLNVSIELVSSYSFDTNVNPSVSGNSLFFIARTSDTQAQLREYVKDDNNSLIVKGVNLTINSPTMLPFIDYIVSETALGFTIMYSKETPNTLYVYRKATSGKERIQSALFRFEFSISIDYMFLFSKRLYVVWSDDTTSYVLNFELLPNQDIKEDTIDDSDTVVSYSSSVTLPKWYPKINTMKTPIDNVQIKKMGIYGSGTFNVDILRENYNYTLTRTYDSGSLKNNKATVAGSSKDTVITIKNSNNTPFRITSISLEGFYKQTSKELR